LRYPNRGGAPTCLDYAVSKNIYGPYERRGTIIDNTGVDPQSWNNHGSILKVGDQWYVFYHGSSNNCKYTRRARVERIEVDELNGYIKTAQMTSMGFADALDPTETLHAAYGYRVWGGAYFTEREDTFPLINVKNGSAVAYRYYDFGACSDWQMNLTGVCKNGGMVKVLINGAEKACVPCLDENSAFSTMIRLKGLEGLCDVKLVFAAEHSEEILELNTIGFVKIN
jgi:hypothetical protein